MKIITRKVQIFLTEDGAEYANEHEAREHEKELARLCFLSFFRVRVYTPTTQVHKLYQVAVDRKISPRQQFAENFARAIVQNWAYGTLGFSLYSVENGNLYYAWDIDNSDYNIYKGASQNSSNVLLSMNPAAIPLAAFPTPQSFKKFLNSNLSRPASDVPPLTDSDLRRTMCP